MSLIRQFFNDPMTSDMDTILANDPFFSSVARRDPFSALMRPMLTGSEFFSPRVDVWDAGDSIRVHADLPGVPTEKVNAQIINGNLQIEGETEDIKNFENMTSRVRERRYGKFSRVVGLPQGIDEGNVKAEFKNGVLEMTIPKTKKAQAKRIDIA